MVKERNMLMTEKHILVQLNNRFPNPGRVKKVKLGMNRIKQGETWRILGRLG